MVLVQLMKLDVRSRSSTKKNGFFSRKGLEKILRGSFQSQIPVGMYSKVGLEGQRPWGEDGD